MGVEDEPLMWTVELEVSLFHAMRNHKPVGVNKHFQMASIQDKLNSSTRRHVTAKQIWSQLTTMYDLTALDEVEAVPFPNKTLDFALPADWGRDSVDTASNVSLDEISSHRDRHESGSSTRGSSKSEKIERGSASILDDSKNEDTPPAPPSSSSSSTKRDGRKRTRHSLQSESTPKRQRRT